MQVAMLSKALISAAYRKKLKYMAPLVAHLSAFVPTTWGHQTFEYGNDAGYEVTQLGLRFSGSYHLHYYPGFRSALSSLSPQSDLVVHVDEEPYNLATYLALRDAHAIHARTIFFSWQNIYHNYPPPFSWMEQYAYKNCDAAIAGNNDAAAVMRAKGAMLPIHVLPQFGVDEHWLDTGHRPDPAAKGLFVAGFAGRLVPEKGVDLLLQAVSKLPGVFVKIVGDGPERHALGSLAATLGCADRVSFSSALPSEKMPEFYATLDTLILPSRTLPNWKEQFGRVLIEAMACGVPVIGARSGEIPNLIGATAGLQFEEGDPLSLRTQLEQLSTNAPLAHTLQERGRTRVRESFTMRQIAERTIAIYNSLDAPIAPGRMRK